VPVFILCFRNPRKKHYFRCNANLWTAKQYPYYKQEFSLLFYAKLLHELMSQYYLEQLKIMLLTIVQHNIGFYRSSHSRQWQLLLSREEKIKNVSKTKRSFHLRVE